MTAETFYELIGYLGSALIIVSILQKSIYKLRLVGLIGSLTFLTYGALIGSIPIMIVNIVGGGIHLFYLSKLVRRPSEVFTVLRVRAESKLMEHFLEFYADDIAAGFNRNFSYAPSDDQITSFILRDMVPAGLFIGRKHSDRSVEIVLDYVIPQYRDFKIGRFLYSRDAGLFFDPTLTELWAETTDPEYVDYLNRMGFERAADRWALPIPPIVAPSAPMGNG